MSYAIALMEDMTKVVTIVGTFRTQEAAEAEAERMMRCEDQLDPDYGLEIQVVLIEDGPTVRRRLREVLSRETAFGGTIQP